MPSSEDAYLDELAEKLVARLEGRHLPPDTPLEPGEADLTNERRTLATGAASDPQTEADPYKQATQVHGLLIGEGRKEKVALGAAINSVVNAAARGDRRVILDSRSIQGRRDSYDDYKLGGR